MDADPKILDSVDQAETYDESAGSLTGGWFERNIEYKLRTVRDARLAGRLDEVHRDRAAEPVSAGVVFGAAHMPAVAAHLCGKLGCIAASSEWLTANASTFTVCEQLGRKIPRPCAAVPVVAIGQANVGRVFLQGIEATASTHSGG
jgi:hypothetical protein